MSPSLPLPLRRIASLALLLPLSACIVVPAHHGAYGAYGGGPAPVYSPGPAYGGGVVMAPPPAPVEVPPPMPFVGAIWIAGFWNWEGHRHVWVPGRWDAPRGGPPRGDWRGR